MTSGGGAFSAEEVAYLKTLPAVADATRNRIVYATAFKVDCVLRYAQGESPVQLFREAGLDPSLIGYKRIECAIARWRRQMHVSVTAARQSCGGGGMAGAHDRASDDASATARSIGARSDIRDMLIAQQVRRINELEHQVDELSHRVRQLSSECDGGGVSSVKASSDVGRDLTDACGGIGA